MTWSGVALLVASTFTRTEDEEKVQLQGAEVVLGGAQGGHCPGKDLYVTADCISLQGPDLTLPGQNVVLHCRELRLPPEGFTINVSGNKGIRDYALGWQPGGDSLSLKASQGSTPGADGERGDDGDNGLPAGNVTIKAHCLTGGCLHIFANGGHGGKAQSGGDGAAGSPGLPGQQGGKGGNGGCAGTSGRGGDAGNINVSIVAMPNSELCCPCPSSSSAPICPPPEHNRPTQADSSSPSPGPSSSPQAHMELKWPPSAAIPSAIPLAKRCTIHLPELCNDPGIGGAAAEGGFGGSGGPGGLAEVTITANRHLWTLIPYFTAETVEKKPPGLPGLPGKKGKRGKKGVRGKSGHSCVAPLGIAELVVTLGLLHCQMMAKLAEQLYLCEETTMAEALLEWLCELTLHGTGAHISEIHRRCSLLLQFLSKGYDVYGQPTNFTTLVSLSCYSSHNRSLLERLHQAEELLNSYLTKSTSTSDTQKQLESTLFMAQHDVEHLEQEITQHKLKKAQAESEILRLTALLERNTPALQRAKTAFFSAVVQTVEGEERERLTNDLWDRLAEFGRIAEKVWTKIPRKDPKTLTFREGLKTLELTLTEGKKLLNVFKWNPPTSQGLAAKINTNNMDQWVQQYSQLPEGAVYAHHQQLIRELMSTREHYCTVASQCHQSIMNDSMRVRQRKADIAEAQSGLLRSNDPTQRHASALIQHTVDELQQQLVRSLHCQNRALNYATLQKRQFRPCGVSSILLEAEVAQMEISMIQALAGVGRSKQKFVALPIILNRKESPALFQALEEDGIASFTIPLSHAAFDGLCHVTVCRAAIWIPGASLRLCGGDTPAPFIQCRLVHTGANVAVRSNTNWRHEFTHPARATLVACYTGRGTSLSDSAEGSTQASSAQPDAHIEGPTKSKSTIAPKRCSPSLFSHANFRAYAEQPELAVARLRSPATELGGDSQFMELSPAATWRLEAVDLISGEPLCPGGVNFEGAQQIVLFFDGTFLPAVSNDGGASTMHQSIVTHTVPPTQNRRRHHRGTLIMSSTNNGAVEVPLLSALQQRWWMVVMGALCFLVWCLTSAGHRHEAVCIPSPAPISELS